MTLWPTTLRGRIAASSALAAVVAAATVGGGGAAFGTDGWVTKGLGLVGVALGTLAGVLISRRIAAPIEIVSKAVADVVAGDLDARAVPKRVESGDPAALIANFNRMADGFDKAERELSESASAIAHELRTPVTVLRARLQAMLDGVFQPSERELVGLIAQTDMLAAIIDNLRVLSLTGAERLELQRERVDLAAEASHVLAAMGPDLIAAGLTVETNLASAISEADASRIRQVITAFLDNARRYAAEGGSLRVETQRIGNVVHLAVLDRGPGLPPGTHEIAFDRFWRGELSRARVTGGTGLGLAVARAVAEQHGGRVFARPRDGGGTVFGIELTAA